MEIPMMYDCSGSISQKVFIITILFWINSMIYRIYLCNSGVMDDKTSPWN